MLSLACRQPLVSVRRGLGGESGEGLSHRKL